MRLSRKEVVERVPMSYATFDRWRVSGKLEVVREEKRIFVTLESLGKALGIEDETRLRERLGLPKITEQLDHCPNETHSKPVELLRDVPDITTPDAFSPRELSPEERATKFAADYQTGEATDSM